MKTTFSAIGGWLWALLAPVAPCAALCSLLVLVETLSAYARNRRLRAMRVVHTGSDGSAGSDGSDKNPSAPLSRLLAGAVATLTRVHIALIVAALLRTAVLDGGDFLTVDVVRLTAGVISLWQIVTILENESIAVPSARRKFLLTLRRWIIKKAKAAAT